MSNNPFLDHSEPAGFSSRYPDLAGPTGPSQPSWPSLAPGLPQSQSYIGQNLPYGSQAQSPSYVQQNGSGYGYGGNPTGPYGASPQSPTMTGAPSGFQPSSSFGQQFASSVGAGYGYDQGQGQQYGTGMGYQPAGAAWNPQQQQVLSQFDPYSQLGQFDSPQGSGAGLFGGSVGPTSPTHTRSFSSSVPPSAVTLSSQPPGQLHPREFVYRHKGELELWDAYAWKQLLNSFDALKGAWEVRKREADDRIRGLGGAVNWDQGAAYEARRLQGVANEAGNNSDSIAASAFQTKEVHSSYRQSGDLASKRRVREAINASLNSLPDWPPQGQW